MNSLEKMKQKLSESEIREYADQIDFTQLPPDLVFSKDFIRQFRDRFNLSFELNQHANDDDFPIKFWKEMGFEIEDNTVFCIDWMGANRGVSIWNKEGTEIARKIMKRNKNE